MNLAATLHSMLARHAATAPEAAALLGTEGEAIGYAALEARVRSLEHTLHLQGATRATRIALVLPNGPDMALAFLAAAGRGACAPLNPAFKAAEFEYYLADLGAQFVLVGRNQATPARAVAAAMGIGVIEVPPLFQPGAHPAAGQGAPAHGLEHGRAHEREQVPAPRPGDVALVLHTSGTTGRPRIVPLTHANLLATARSIATEVRLTPADRCLNVMPLFHIHGLVGSLLSTLSSGGSLVCTSGFDGEAFFRWVGATQPSWYTAGPTIHEGVCAAGARYAREAPGHRFRFLRSASSALAPRTLAALEALTGAPVIETYGMTETASQLTSNPLPPGQRKPGTVGRAAGAEVAVMNAQGELLATGERGEVVVRGPGVMAGYEGGAEANARAFAGGWLRTGDEGVLGDEGYLTITGRLKEMVNRGGEKVAPREVDEALLEHTAVAEAVAFGVLHPTLGEDLAAVVVLAAGRVADEAALRRHLFERLAAFKVPTRIVFVDTIPKSATGKVQRTLLHERLALRLRAAYEAPRGATEVAVAAQFAQSLACSSVGRHDNFFALGGDSLMAAAAAGALARALGVLLQAVELFEHPTVVALAAHIEARRTTQDVLDTGMQAAALSAALNEPRPGTPGSLHHDVALMAHPPRAVPGAAALSFSQEALWFVEQLLGHASAYNSFHCAELVGPLDEAALQRALTQLVARHDALRTGISVHGGQPVARVEAATEFVIQRRTAEGACANARRTAALRIAQAFVEAPFTLERAPLMRAALVAIEPRRHWLVLVVHHLVTDGSSTALLATEFARLYDIECAVLPGDLEPLPPPQLPAVPLQFPDFAAWQRQRLQGPRLEALLDYWRRTLSGIEPLALPTSRARPLEPSYQGHTLAFTLPPDCATAVRALARRELASPFMVLLAAFQALLARIAGSEDVAVSTPVAGRTEPETFRCVGYFVNSLVLRTQLGGDPSFAALLARVRATVLGAFAHDELPFDRLVSELNPHRDLSRNPLVQISFALNNQPPVALALTGLEVAPVQLPVSTSKFDLSLAFVERAGEYEGTIEYATALFDLDMMEGLARSYGVLLQAALEEPKTTLSRLPLLDATRRRRLIERAADAPPPRAGAAPREMGHAVPREALLDETPSASQNAPQDAQRGAPRRIQPATLHERIAHQASQNPSACAVVHGPARTDYASLLEQAGRIAALLARLGVTRGDTVVLCAERSAGLIAAVVGILRAGGVYVPIDPATPAARARFICADAGARVVLTEPAWRDQFAGIGVTVVALDGGEALAQEQAAGASALPAVEPSDLAYILYTSGSTGQPKGVEVSHASACNHGHWFAGAVGAHAQDRFLFKTSIGFDASLVEILVPLSFGATIVVAEADAELDPRRVIATLVHQQVTVMQAVPSALRLLLAEPGLAQVRALRFLVSGGEALDWALVREARKRLPAVQLGNFYGPTETCIDATWYPIDARTDGEGPVPIGWPVAGMRAHVLDAQLEPLPDGVTGELYLGGAGLARGYRNRPELTQRAFIADPFQAGQRLYATGDLVRRRADGALVYMGRANDQIKLRGFRIELGEIESVLRAQAEIAHCVVRPHERLAGDVRLVAYVVLSKPVSPLDSAALRLRLAAFLPEYMLPSAWVVLEQLPLTASGKIDRTALPAPGRDAAQEVRAIEPPQGAIESALADLWRGLLGVAEVGRNDDFFALGGHSLLVVALVDAMRRHSMVVDVRTVFHAPRLSALAAAAAPGLVHEATLPAASGAVPAGCTRVEPWMLPLVTLSQPQIDHIAATLPGHAANLQDVLPLAPLQVGILWRHMLEDDAQGQAAAQAGLRPHHGLERHQAAGKARGGADGYVGRWVLEFDEPARRTRFLQAMQQLIERHDALRTSLRWEGLETPVQVVQRHAPLLVHEVAAVGGGGVLEALLEASDPQRVAMDLRRAPLMAAWTADDTVCGQWLLALNHHDAVLDQVSQQVMLDELRAQMAAAPAGAMQPMPTLPPAPQWRSWLARVCAEGFAPHAPHFKALLGDVEEPTLPFARTDVDRLAAPLHRHRGLLDAPLEQAVRAAAAEAGVAVAVLMHAAWACVVGACSGRDDVVFGTVLSGRSRRMPGIDRMVGLFINTLPVRLRLADTTVPALLEETRRQLGELLARESATLVDAQRCSAVPAGGPHFGALINYRHNQADWVALDTDGAATQEIMPGVRRLRSDSPTHYPFGLTVDDLGTGMVITTHAVEGVDPARLAAFLATVLANLARALREAPQRPVAELGVLHGAEIAQLAHFSVGPALRADLPSVHRSVEAQAALRPDARAIEDNERAARYGELEARSNRIARALRERGVGRGARVGLCVERGAALVAALLGILKSGAAYVPLDPAYPKDRLQYMAADAALAVLVTEGTLGPCLDWPREGTLLLDADKPWIESLSPSPLPDDVRSARPADPAYVIYTSGSTGKPKGVVVPHGAAANFLASMAREPGLAAGDRLLAVTTPSFDIAVLELLLPLTVGATVVLATRAQAGDGFALRSHLQDSGANVMQATPATWRLLIDAGWRGTGTFKALVGGEALNPELAAELLHRTGESWNMYGPTETTVWSTCWRVRQPQDGISIGRPIANTTVRVLDACGRLCPIGVAGELCIGGAGVAVGYWKRPELTAERFIPDPYAATAGARLYRTGDLARWRPDGELEHLGRIDQQIKLRGFRIEPGEIESALVQHAGVREAVVVARTMAAGDARLVAYVRFATKEEVAAATLWEHLRKSLPEHMVPAHLVTMLAFPLTPSGKVDRRALPDPLADLALAAQGPRRPFRTASELLLAEIWAELLGHHEIGVDDNFFDLGGHSLLVMQAIARIESKTGVALGPRHLMFDTLAQLATRLAEPPRPAANVEGAP